MQLQFSKKILPYLRRAVWEVKNEEYTQEVKLPESLPDIGRILGVWGQPLIRSKEWRGSNMSVSGGIMVWILYAPEEGAQQCVETWIPFQTQWDFPQTQYDAAMRISCHMKGIDARSVSARKMMVRVVLNIAGEAMEPTQAEWYQCADVPEDVHILKNNYPLRLPIEAGEKTLTLDEELTYNGGAGQISQVLYCTLRPELTDQKVMADKVVYRGIARAEMLCRCAEGTLESCEYEIPFSQYGELEREYDGHATSDVLPVVTNLEVDVQDNGTLRLKAGLVGQYVIYDTAIVDVVTDAYSNRRAVTLQRNELKLPAVLEIKQEVLPVESADESLPDEILDMRMLLQHPSLSRIGDGWLMEIPGSFQLLGRDDNDNLVSSHIRWENKRDILSDAKASVIVRSSQKGKLKKMGSNLAGEITVDMTITTETDIPMIESLELGELQKPDENRPSLILRRVGKDSLWEIAKSCGSSVEDIRLCNGIASDPTEESILLIPVS